MYYISDGKVYVKKGNVFQNVSITAKDKVITKRELESVTVVHGTVTAETLENPSVLTLEEIIKKFNLSEEHPIPFASDGVEKALSDMTLTELKAYAKEHEIDLGTATKKADILAVLEAAVAEGSEDSENEPEPEPEIS